MANIRRQTVITKDMVTKGVRRNTRGFNIQNKTNVYISIRSTKNLTVEGNMKVVTVFYFDQLNMV
jgi:hypothetical protein